MTADDHLDKQISSRSAVYTRLTFFTDTDTLPVIDTGGNADLDLFAVIQITGTAASRAFLPDYFSGSVTVGAGRNVLHNAKQRLLRHAHLTAAAALCTRLGTGSGLRPGSVTVGTLILKYHIDLFFTVDWKGAPVLVPGVAFSASGARCG